MVLAGAAWAHGSTEERLAAMQAAIAAQPGRGGPYLARGQLFRQQKRPSEALDDFTRAAQLEPHLPGVHRLIARALLDLGRLAEAGALDEASVRLGRPVVLELEAIDLAQQRRRFDEALARIDAFAANLSRKETWLMRKATILTTAHRPAAARAAYQATLDAIARLPPHIQNSRAVIEMAAQARTGAGKKAPYLVRSDVR
jgi:tetratricopeptide (TPR) repeat protein